MSVSQTAYKDQRAVVLESGAARFVLLPDTGAGLASAYSKARQKEYLVQRPQERYLRQPFDGVYTDAECAGVDDMFPTIDRCAYDRFPWTGTPLSDHGEVWNLPCETQIGENSVRFTCHGVRLPYVFHKTASMPDDNTLLLAYRVENPTAFAMDFLWAGHAMVVAEPGLTLHVPEDCRRGVAVFSNTGRIGGYGARFDYPAYTDAQGVPRDVSRMDARDGNCEKYYFENNLAQGWCAVTYPAGDALGISFTAQTVPYLGILHNAGDFRGLFNIFLEPCTCAFDRPDVARLHGQSSTVKAHSAYEWQMAIRIGAGSVHDAVMPL
jgi:hypothetical protein